MPFDVGAGLLLGIWTHSFSGLTYAESLILGIIACLLPDLDFIWPHITKRYAHDKDHRDGLHYPLLFIPIVGIAGWLIHPWIGLLLLVGALEHFLHDSIGIGWGVKWLYPLRNISYCFFYRVPLAGEKDMPKRLVYHWNDGEKQVVMRRYADPHWIKQTYFRPSAFGLVEYAVLIIGVSAAIVFRT